MTPSEILNEIYRLPSIKQKEILDSLSENLSEDEAKDLQLQKALFEVGMLREIKLPRHRKIGDFKAVKIKGKPISETIIEERR